MKRKSNNPAKRTATGTQKWESVSMLCSRLDAAFVLGSLSIQAPGKAVILATFWGGRLSISGAL
jgi:hypothetical protein